VREEEELLERLLLLEEKLELDWLLLLELNEEELLERLEELED
jgi:hypothetical protein